jgi:TolB-like protein/predicted Zn-dependent protease
MYEMLTGHLPFDGETASDMLAHIIERQPDWEVLPQDTPTNIRVLLRRCLEKEPRRRLRDIGDIAITLEDTTTELQHPTLRTGPVEAGRAKPTKWSRRALPWLITGTAMAILVLFAFIIGLKLGQLPDEKEGKAISLPTVKPINAIVVLPFENLSGDPEQEYFVDGMTDALSAELGKIRALRVISRTSAMRYKNTDKSVPEIVKELGVDAAIEGSVLKAGNDVRVTAQLVDGRTDAHLWSENYTGTLTNILVLQSEVTLAIAREIEAELTPEEERRITRTKSVNPEAYEAYLLGRHYLDKSLEPDIDVAIEYFKRALEIDSTYAIAHAGLADAYTYFGFADIRSPENTWPNARAAAEEALAIDEGLSEAHTSLATVKSWFEWDWPGAEREYKRALEINSNSVGAHLWYARFLSAMERHTEAIAQVERALELDPYSLYVNYFRAWALYYAGHKNEAIQLVENAIDSYPDHPLWYWCLTSFYASQGMYEQALTPLKTQMDLMGDDINDELGFLGYLYGRLGRKAEALRQLEALDELAAKGRYVSPVNRSCVHIGLDDKDQAMAWLEKGYERRAGFWMVFLKAYFIFDPLRDDPRFQDLLRRMNFPETPSSGATPKPIEAAQAPIEKIAVLPFTSISNESGEEWFVDGMTDALITQLGKIKALTVISRTSAMQYKNISKPMREISQDLGVDALVEGSIIRAGNDVQVTARLIDGRTDERIWGDFFRGGFSDILALQTEVTLAIAQEIEAALTPEEETRITRTELVNPEAYEYYLRGNEYFHRGFDESDFKIAIRMYDKAVELDTRFASAYAQLSRAHLYMYWLHDLVEERLAMAEDALGKVLEIAPDLFEAHLALGHYYYHGLMDYDRALEQFEIARKGQPNNSEVMTFIGYVQRRQGRFEEAVVSLKRASELDPLSNVLASQVGGTFMVLRKYPEAEYYLDRAISLAPDEPGTYGSKARLYLRWEGSTRKARDVLDEAVQNIESAADNAYVFNALVEIDVFDDNYQEALDRLSSKSEDIEDHHNFIPNALRYALIYGYMNNKERAKKSYEEARTILESKIEERPEDARFHSSLGIAYAGLGRKEDAIREGRRAVELCPEGKEAWRALNRLEALAQIYAMVGESDAAIEELEYLLSRPGEMSKSLLRLDPTWDPLRDHPRFKELLEAE